MWGFLSVLSTIVAAVAGWGEMHFGIPSCPRRMSVLSGIFPLPSLPSSTEGSEAIVSTTPPAAALMVATTNWGRLREFCPRSAASIAPYHCQEAAGTLPACSPLIVGEPLSSWKYIKIKVQTNHSPLEANENVLYYMHVDFYPFKITQQMNKKITLYLSFILFHFFLACLAVMVRPEEATNWLRKEKRYSTIVSIKYV